MPRTCPSAGMRSSAGSTQGQEEAQAAGDETARFARACKCARYPGSQAAKLIEKLRDSVFSQTKLPLLFVALRSAPSK